MRRTLTVLLVGALLVGLGAPASIAGKKKKKERTAEATYVGGAPAGAAGSGMTPCGTDCARFEVKPGERYVSLHFADASGQPVYASVYVYGFSDGTDTHEHVCGESTSPLALEKGLKELVVMFETSGGAAAGCPGPPTTGTVHAVFSNVR
jgi:hypothetical protein